MSLGRLLAAGRSLMGLRGGEGRYREDKRVRLPRFVSPKNPFTTAADAGASPAQPAAARLAVAEPPVPVETKTAPGQARAAGSTGWLAGWSAKLNPLARARRGAGPARSLPPQQGELSLDRVQVVRNDLRDSDFAVTRPAAVKAVSPVMARTAETLEPVGAAWNRLATRFLGEDQR